MSKLIPLTQGKCAIVDDQDYEWLSRWKWCAIKPRKTWYAVRAEYLDGKRKNIYMHRFILNAPRGTEVDHANWNGLDNRRCNIRLATSSQNSANIWREATTKTPYRGIYRNRGAGWYAVVQVNYKRIRLGAYPTAEIAASAYDRAAISHFGEFAVTNGVGSDLIEIYETSLRTETPEERQRIHLKQKAAQYSGKKHINKSSRYRGVCLSISGSWRARIGIGRNKIISLGCFLDEEKAARAYDEAAIKFFGESAKLNFPRNGAHDGK